MPAWILSRPVRTIGIALSVAASFAMGSMAIYFDGRGAEPLSNGSLFLPLNLIASFGFPVIGALISLRRPGNVIGRLFLLCGVFSGIQAASGAYVASRPAPSEASYQVGAAWLLAWTWVPAQGGVTMSLLLFPEGRAPSPRWGRLVKGLLGVVVLGSAAQALAPFEVTASRATVENPMNLEPASLSVALTAFTSMLLLAFLVAALVSLLVRFRGSTGEARAQMKWICFGGCIMLLGLALGGGIELLSTSSPQTGSNLAAYWIASSILAVPIAVAVAILRYHLFDIDRVINRTLVYGLSTGLLAGCYFGLVLGISVVSPLHSSSPVVVAVSTLAVAALFRPLLTRIRSAVDRRFNRARYDAARTLESFSQRLRSEVEIDSLSDGLLAVVEETMQPRRAALWLRPGGGQTGA